MDAEQLKEFHGILEENGWTKLSTEDLRELKILRNKSIIRNETFFIFKGSQILKAFADFILENYIEFGI